MNFEFNTALLGLVKLLLIVGGILYLFFSVIIIRQITVMRKTLITALEPEISALGWIHLGLTVGLLVYFVVL